MLFRTVWRRVVHPTHVRYAALPAVVAAGLVGHTSAELNMFARDLIGPMGIGSTTRHVEVAIITRLIDHTLHGVATFRYRRRRY